MAATFFQSKIQIEFVGAMGARVFDDIGKRVEKDKRMVFIIEQKVSSSCQSRYREQKRVELI